MKNSWDDPVKKNGGHQNAQRRIKPGYRRSLKMKRNQKWNTSEFLFFEWQAAN
jgi:hypothetical protein